MLAAGMQPFLVQSCVPLLATGTRGPRAFGQDGFMTLTGVSQEVQTSFLPTSTVVKGPRPLCQPGLVSVTDTRRESVQAGLAFPLRATGATGGGLSELPRLRQYCGPGPAMAGTASPVPSVNATAARSLAGNGYVFMGKIWRVPGFQGWA